MISRRHVAQETVPTPSRVRGTPPPDTGAMVRDPGAVTVPDTMVMTGQDRLNRPRGRPESPSHRLRRPESPQAETASGTLLSQAQDPFRRPLASLFPSSRRAGMMFVW